MKLHPACAILSFSVFFSGMVFAPNPLYTAILLIFCTAVFTMTSGAKKVLKCARLAVFYIILGSMINIVISSNGATLIFKTARIPLIGRIDATLEELLFGANMGLKIVGMFMLLGMYSDIIDPDSAFDFFSRRLKKLTLTVSLISNIMHNLRGEIERISSVMRLRGVDFCEKGLLERSRSFYFMAKVVIISSLEGSIDYSQAIYSKGYPSAERTFYEEIRISSADRQLCILSALNVLSILWLHIAGCWDYSFYPKLERLTQKDVICCAAVLGIMLVHIAFFWRRKQVEDI